MDTNNPLTPEAPRGPVLPTLPQPKKPKWLLGVVLGLIVVSGALFFSWRQSSKQNLIIKDSNNIATTTTISVIENDPLLEKYGKYPFDTFKSYPDVLSALKKMDSEFTDLDMVVSIPNKIAVFNDGRKLILMDGCFPHSCANTQKVALYEPVNKEVYLQTEYGYFANEDNTTIQRFLANYYLEKYTIRQATSSIVIYVKPGTPDSNTRALNTWVGKQSWVASIAYTSAAQELEAYKINHKNDQLILGSIKESGENLFGGTITVILNDSSQKIIAINSISSSEYKSIIEHTSWK